MSCARDEVRTRCQSGGETFVVDASVSLVRASFSP